MKVFDEKQQEVINFNSGCALVLGAPGCGKTDILSHRLLRAHQCVVLTIGICFVLPSPTGPPVK